MVWIKPGTFTLGSPDSEPQRNRNEGPQMVVTISRGFWMGVHEVTQEEYLAMVGANPSWFHGDRSAQGGKNFGTDMSRPVEQVSWSDATNYCRIRTTAERRTGRIPAGWSYRLPTEAEWEYACRAGARSSTHYGFGDDLIGARLNQHAWFSENSGGATHPVGKKPANAWGLMDMHGNVSEWCQDFYGTYHGGTATDWVQPRPEESRVTRGGGWVDPADDCRTAGRSSVDPLGTDSCLGFRVVLSPDRP